MTQDSKNSARSSSWLSASTKTLAKKVVKTVNKVIKNWKMKEAM